MPDPLITDIGGHPAGEIPKEGMNQLYWEKLMIAMFGVLSSKGIYNLDEFRRTVESMHPDEYKKSHFYWRRLDAMANLLVEKGHINYNELVRRANERLASGRRDHAV